jgi:tetratricopeptide (TPR) repeat protein
MTGEKKPCAAILETGWLCLEYFRQVSQMAQPRKKNVLPRDVPQGLTAEQYFALGIQYRTLGWTEQARDALILVTESSQDDDLTISAQRFLKTKIPRFPVPLLAEQRHIEGFNRMATGDQQGARKAFEELIEDFPDFEWPYGQLSVIFLQEGETAKAKKLLKRALAINPNYIGGWLHMATAKGLELDFDGAQACVDKALDADPTDAAALAMQDALKQLKDL